MRWVFLSLIIPLWALAAENAAQTNMDQIKTEQAKIEELGKISDKFQKEINNRKAVLKEIEKQIAELESAIKEVTKEQLASEKKLQQLQTAKK